MSLTKLVWQVENYDKSRTQASTVTESGLRERHSSQPRLFVALLGKRAPLIANMPLLSFGNAPYSEMLFVCRW